MNQAITHISAGPIPLLVLNKLLGFLRRLDVALQKRAQRRLPVTAAVAGVAPHTPLSLWATAALTAGRHERRD